MTLPAHQVDDDEALLLLGDSDATVAQDTTAMVDDAAVPVEEGATATPPPPPPVQAPLPLGTIPEAGRLLWVRFTPYPWWPAICVDPASGVAERPATDAHERNYLVQFFGTHEFAWVDPDVESPAVTVMPFVLGPSLDLASDEVPGLEDVSWRTAVDDALGVQAAADAADDVDGGGGRDLEQEEETDEAYRARKEARRREKEERKSRRRRDAASPAAKKSSGGTTADVHKRRPVLKQPTLHDVVATSSSSAAARRVREDAATHHHAPISKRRAADAELQRYTLALQEATADADTAAAQLRHLASASASHEDRTSVDEALTKIAHAATAQLLALRSLVQLDVTFEQLRTTRIGVAVGALIAEHRSSSVASQVRILAQALLEFWFLRLDRKVRDRLVDARPFHYSHKADGSYADDFGPPPHLNAPTTTAIGGVVPPPNALPSFGGPTDAAALFIGDALVDASDDLRATQGGDDNDDETILFAAATTAGHDGGRHGEPYVDPLPATLELLDATQMPTTQQENTQRPL